MPPAISIKSLGKKYQLGATLKNKQAEEFWALKDVSFDVQPGEIVGVIGRNGAGKSTLLKILSQITAPTEGEVRLRGRVSSLLEVGTGFHPELTGRENIFLNGAILGMRRAEIREKLDAIVDFSGVEKFLDTPVKRYSSGMYVRLAFAVAAHLEPEILIVDEVLAVGDAQFQQRCLGKMKDVADGGRTVLLVSHNLVTIKNLCQRCIWLRDGQIVREGEPSEVVTAYLSVARNESGEYSVDPNFGSDSACRITAARVKSSNGEVMPMVDASQSFQIEIDHEARKAVSHAWIGIQVVAETGEQVFSGADGDEDAIFRSVLEPGRVRTVCEVPAGLLNAGRYTISVFAARTPHGVTEVLDWHEGALQIITENPAGVGELMPKHRQGVVSPRLHWRRSVTPEN